MHSPAATTTNPTEPPDHLALARDLLYQLRALLPALSADDAAEVAMLNRRLSSHITYFTALRADTAGH